MVKRLFKMGSVKMDYSVHLVMAEYNKKTSELNKARIITDNRNEEFFSYFSNPDELNNNVKCDYSLKKYGDSRLFGDYIEDFE